MVNSANMRPDAEGYRWESRADGEFFGLSPRRLEVFDDWILGMTVGQTADDLTLSEKTVKTYRGEISRSIRDRCASSLPIEGSEEAQTRMALTRAVIRRVAGRVADGSIEVSMPADVFLTARESEVGGLMLKGMGKGEVSMCLRYTKASTEVLFRSIHSKLGLADLKGGKYVPAVARLVALAMKHEAKGHNDGNS